MGSPGDIPTEIRHNARKLSLLMAIHHSSQSVSEGNETRESNHRPMTMEKRHKMISTCRRHDSMPGKSQRINDKITQHIQQDKKMEG